MTEGLVITLVEDDESLRQAIKRLIKAVGFTVEDFASAEDFLCSQRSQDAACLILDVRLPGMSGLELQSQLAADDCRVPIIFISALGDGNCERGRSTWARSLTYKSRSVKTRCLRPSIQLFSSTEGKLSAVQA